MRLAIVSPFLDRQHGTELCIIEEIERFARHDDWNIEIYSQRVEQLDGVRSASTSSSNPQGSIFWRKVPAVPGPHLFQYVWWFFANHLLRWWDSRRGCPRPDLIFSPGINCLDADVIVVPIVFQAFYERVRSELALNCVPPKSWPLLIHRRMYYRLVRSLERKVYADPRVRLIAVSTLVAKQLQTYFRRTDVTVIPSAVDTDRFSPEMRQARRADARKSLAFSEKECVLLLIGNDWKNKGLGAVLRALSLLRDLPIRLLVVGRDDPVLFRPLIFDLGLRDRVRFDAPSNDVLFFYAAADLYVGPSLYDSFGLPILESMACGLPVIASINAGASENIRDTETGFILHNPRDASEIARLIRLLFDDSALRQRLGHTASEYVQANCGWDQNAEKTRQLFETTLRQRFGN